MKRTNDKVKMKVVELSLEELDSVTGGKGGTGTNPQVIILDTFPTRVQAPQVIILGP